MLNTLNTLNALNPLDGRYSQYTKLLKPIFSEQGLIVYRIKTEVLYLLRLIETLEPNLKQHSDYNNIKKHLKQLYKDNTQSQEIAQNVKNIEREIKHDVKSIEYYLKNWVSQFEGSLPKIIKPYIHFGLTSQDITTISLWMQLRDAKIIIKNHIETIEQQLRTFFNDYKNVPMLSRTHGQPASPTTVGKEFMVFAERLHRQLNRLDNSFNQTRIKFGGAIGNLNAHTAAYPHINWIEWCDKFIESIGFKRARFTTQIDHYDGMGEMFDCVKRVNTILIDLCKDVWEYISRQYFILSINEKEVGSSTMPHKVNPIDFENAEGNLQLANCILEFFSRKLPISRMQRDLTDSTVTRNFGVAFGYCVVGYTNIGKGLLKIKPNLELIHKDLENTHVVVAEAIQTVLKTEKIDNSYQLLKNFTRKHTKPTKTDFEQFINNLDIDEQTKQKLLNITPHNYIGIFPEDYK